MQHTETCQQCQLYGYKKITVVYILNNRTKERIPSDKRSSGCLQNVHFDLYGRAVLLDRSGLGPGALNSEWRLGELFTEK